MRIDYSYKNLYYILMNTIKWHIKALKQLRKTDRQENASIRQAVNGLASMPNCAGVKALTNHTYGFRLRVGRYRVFFDFDGEIRIVEIQEVKKRDERTY
jgi:mRNA-degrading endonuclease RelE of RelBE toxin-antitoxin system